jgi:hypothetical protein
VDLEKVDVVRVEAGKAGVDLVEDGLARETGLVHVVAGVLKLGVERSPHAGLVVGETKALGQDRDAMTGNVELRKRSTSAQWLDEDERTCLRAFPIIRSLSPLLYTLAVSQVLDQEQIRSKVDQKIRIYARYTTLPGSLQKWQSLGLLDDPRRPLVVAKGHGAQDGHRHAKPALSEATILDLRRLGGHDDSV